MPSFCLDPLATKWALYVSIEASSSLVLKYPLDTDSALILWYVSLGIRHKDASRWVFIDSSSPLGLIWSVDRFMIICILGEIRCFYFTRACTKTLLETLVAIVVFIACLFSSSSSLPYLWALDRRFWWRSKCRPAHLPFHVFWDSSPNAAHHCSLICTLAGLLVVGLSQLVFSNLNQIEFQCCVCCFWIVRRRENEAQGPEWTEQRTLAH